MAERPVFGLSSVHTSSVELLVFATTAFVMVVVVLGAGATVEILFDRRFGVSGAPRRDPRAQAHQHGVRSRLGGFGPGGGTQH